MASDPLFGWDLTFKTVEKDIKRKADVIITFIHFNLIKRGFKSIGVGDERTLSGDEDKSELLPTGWNDNENYTLRYVLDEKLYILHGLNTDGNLIVNLMRSEDLAVSNVAVKIDDAVKEMSGPIEKMLPSHKDLMFNVKRDLIDTITERSTTTAHTQTTSNSNNRRANDDPLRVPPRPMPGVNPDTPDLWELPPANLPNIGRSDLDPFAPGGGGMIFNPFGPRRDPENPGLGIPGGLPRGAVPPGARFDPFGPPGAGPMPGRRRAPPDADHLPPPGFNDNMFL
ncbi:proteasome inhibitor PI31 subunit [Leptidea sinapis]|uniref:proteasome inhibitor PI31 subunit n=1 Tax=Leptidea sinapis TaxID=189913 RepID=UPI00213F854A|nr:proteasome inhibitor PI31 subunit [Leptidea sinapis]XP_050682030.1 proteasome inhibitor PI31 subunit [Leptidea sinapis]